MGDLRDHEMRVRVGWDADGTLTADVEVDGRSVFRGSPGSMDPPVLDAVAATLAYASPGGVADHMGVPDREFPIGDWVQVPEGFFETVWESVPVPGVRVVLTRSRNPESRDVGVSVRVGGYRFMELTGSLRDGADPGSLPSRILPVVGDAMYTVVGSLDAVRGRIEDDAAVLRIVDEQPAVAEPEVVVARVVWDARRTIRETFSELAGDMRDVTPRGMRTSY